MPNQEVLEAQLNSFHPESRRAALEALASRYGLRGTASDNINLHIHSFFSYNAFGWSPSRIAWEAAKRGLYGVGLCDFDALDGQEEFIAACDLLGLRGLVNVETRTFVHERADIEIDSPGEPGVSYVTGCGFARPLDAGSEPARFLAHLRANARERNLALVARINAALPQIAIGYEQDVLPRTPLGGATERHIVSAYIAKAEAVFDPEACQAFWAHALSTTPAKAAAWMGELPVFEEKVRAKLAKRGGVGYVQPTTTTFPPVRDFFAWVRACGAVPMESWLDGTSPGEADPNALLDLAMDCGAAALNIIPDRNWNIKDLAVKAEKEANLAAIIAAANARHLPIHIGTELNKLGQPYVDDLDGPSLRPFKENLLEGARVLCGHATLLRFANFGYVSAAAGAEFGSNISAKNRFFAAVGALPPVTSTVARALGQRDMGDALVAIQDAVKNAKWPEK